MAHLNVLNTTIRFHDRCNAYSSNDLHRASGGAPHHHPWIWLSLDEFIDPNDEAEAEFQREQLVEYDGVPPGIFFTQKMVHEYAKWISDDFHFEVMHAFDEQRALCIAYAMLDDPTTLRALLYAMREKGQELEAMRDDLIQWREMLENFDGSGGSDKIH